MKNLIPIVLLAFCHTGIALAQDMIKAAGSVFINSSGEKKEAALSGKIVGFYFATPKGASKIFATKLIDFYSGIKKEGRDFEIIFVGVGENASGIMQDAQMPWLAVPTDSAQASALKKIKRAGINDTSIPALIILRDGQIITERGHADVQELGSAAYQKWLTMNPERIEKSVTNKTASPKQPADKKPVQAQKSTPAPSKLEALQKGAASGSKQDRDDYFNQYAKSVQNIYDTRKVSVFKSYRSKKEAPSIKSNYAIELERFFNKTTTAPVSPRNGAFVKTKEGVQTEIYRIYSTDTDAVSIKDGTQEKRVLVSDLDPPSQQLARDLIIDKLFDIRFEMSVRELNVKTRDAVTGSFKGATETTTYAETTYGITLENKSDLPIDDLIVEYQIFFKQTLAGTPVGADEYYRFAGHSIVKAVPAKDKFTITANPPAIIESKLDGASHGNTDYFIRYAKGLNQNCSGRIQGSWIRVHRITPFGRLTRELKEGVYPDDAEWDAIEMVKTDASPKK